MSSNNRTTSRGGKGPKGDKIHKNEKAETGKAASEKHQSTPGAGGDTTSNENKIKQVIEMTQLPETKVCLALHECDYDVEKAVNMLFETPDSQEWETTVKKKKNRQASASKADNKTENVTAGATGDDWNDTPATPGNTEKDKPRNKTGGPQRLHGRHNDSRGWRGREKQENERNLEDSGYRGERRGRSSGSTRGGGGGRGRGGGRAGGGRYPRGNRGGGGSFNSKPMEVWDNASSNTWDNNITSTNHGASEECWDEFPGADEWCGTLSETKVFTPSQQAEAAAAAEADSNPVSVDNSVRQAEALAQMQAQMHAAQNPPVAMSGTLNAAQSQYFTQLTQQNNSDLNKYCPPQQSQSSYANTQQYQASQPPNSYANSAYNSNYGSNVQENVSQQPVRTKTQRARVPPPSKIPSSAVEMPGDINSIGFLDLQFGAMDMMSDSSSFDGVSDNKYQNSSPLDNTTTTNNMDLSIQSQNAANLDAYTPPKAGNQSSISSALSQGLSNADSIPQASEHMSGGYSSAAAATQRTNNVSGGVSANAASNTNSTGLDQMSKQSEPHPYSQSSTYNSYQQKSTSYQNQTYSSNSNYSGAQTTSSYVSNQAASNYVNSDTSYNAPSANSAYPNTYSSNNSYQTSGNTGAFPSISQANAYPSNNQAFQQTASQSVYGANTGLNNSSNYGSSSAAQYSSYNSNHKLGKDASNAYDNSTAATSTVSNTSSSTTSTLSLTQTTASVTKSNTTLGKNSSGVVSNMPPSAPVMSTQYIMGQAVPYFQAPPIYSHEEMQMIQQRLPYMTPTTTLRDGSYSLSDGRFTRTDSNASPVPSTQNSTQPILATQAAGPYYFAAPYNPLQPSYQYGPVYSQLPAGTNAHGSTNSAQYPKQATYGSGYSGYEALSQSQDYNKGYVGNTQSQNKGTGANSSSTGNASNDISAMYGKSHTALAKVNSYDKQGFHSGTPPPYSGPLGQSALTPSGTGYAPQVYIPTIPHQQHHTTPLIHQPLHQMEVRHQGRRMDSTNSSGQRSQVNNQQKSGAKQGYQGASSYWNPS